MKKFAQLLSVQTGADVALPVWTDMLIVAVSSSPDGPGTLQNKNTVSGHCQLRGAGRDEEPGRRLGGRRGGQGGAGVAGSREGMEGTKKVTVGALEQKKSLRVLDPELGRRLGEEEWPGGGAGVAGSREGLEGRSDTKKVTVGAPKKPPPSTKLSPAMPKPHFWRGLGELRTSRLALPLSCIDCLLQLQILPVEVLVSLIAQELSHAVEKNSISRRGRIVRQVLAVKPHAPHPKACHIRH